MTSQTSQTEDLRIQRIQATIKQRDSELREAFPLLKRQNAIGFSIFLFAVTGTLVSGWAYTTGNLSAWLCIPLVAVFTSLLHELEHDLIHWQYFKKNKFIHHGMLLVGWVLRPGTINPWVRRKLHFLHHKVSGTEADIEERGIGNGQSWGWPRFWIMADTFTGNLYRSARQAPKGKKLSGMARITLANFPFGVITALLWYGFLVFHMTDQICVRLGLPVEWSASTHDLMATIDTLVVVLIAPFYLRSFSLNFISSNMHYHGNVSSVLQQTQILNAWYLWPLQLFCFNFGSTHGIHHFVVGEPFYIRQLTAGVAHQVMRENGVRFNDLGTFQRANRYVREPPPFSSESANA